ncbi:MAG TPA: bifunctional diguanylate cyclase/phosphodiesterase [Caproiciproducens sp.]|nr:bifunctional diguanylate cyclase/phosphodiesterase [Caproiciproducens sp.]
MKQNEQTAREYTGIDDLTGGPDGKTFLEKAQNILKENGRDRYAVVSFHVNRFKYINDLFGYENGNKVLKGIYYAMASNLVEPELCARRNADRFVLLLKYRRRNDLENRMNLISADIYRTIEFYGIHYMLKFCMGVYECGKNSPLGVAAMVDRAVIAQDLVEPADFPPYRFYEEAIRTEEIIGKNMEDRLHPALENREFILYYQPKYRLDTGMLAGCEALVRWKTDENTLVPPNEFIPVFEKSRAILQLDRFIFEEACRSVRRWLDSRKHVVPVSVNLSRMHLIDLSFIEDYKSAADSCRVPCELLELELTESAFSENAPAMRCAAEKLHKNGFSLSIDDFGTGYSSLGMLKDIPANTLKLDRSFLLGSSDSANGRKLIENVVRLVRDLGMTPLAEGVETKEQVEFLKKIRCSLAQGYYYAKPLSAPEYERLLQE